MSKTTVKPKSASSSDIEEPRHERLEFVLYRKQMLDAHGNSHFRAKMGKIKFLRDLAREAGEDTKAAKDVFFDKFEILVTIKPPTRRKLDPPNFYPTVKPIIDGLTDAGWWDDDNFAHMLETRFRYGGLSGVKNADGSNDNSAFRVILDIREIQNYEDFVTDAEFVD